MLPTLQKMSSVLALRIHPFSYLGQILDIDIYTSTRA